MAAVGLVAVAFTAAAGAQSRPAKGKAGFSPTAIRVDGNIIKSYIEYMSSDDKQGRKSLTPGYENVALWAAGKFKEWGLKPAGDNGTFLQDVPIERGFSWTAGIPELVVDGRPFYFKDSDFALDPASPAGAPLTAEIVFVGYGISAPAKGLDEYAGIDVKGKLVLAFKGSPKDAPPARGMFGVTAPEPKNVEDWREESTSPKKVTTAFEKGAAGILLFNADRLSGAPAQPQPTVITPAVLAQMQAERVTLDSTSFSRPFYVVTDVDARVFRQVMHREPQESPRGFTSRMEQLRRAIRDRKARSTVTGVNARIKGFDTVKYYAKKFGNNISHNVVGKVEGTDPKLKDQYIVIGGHMDHLGMTNGIVYNGADDDASGTAVTMEMARLIAANAATIKPKRTVIFALWCGEELGLLGSMHWTKTPSDGVKMENVVANFNLDMVGLGERIGAPGALNFPALYDVIMRNQDGDVAKAVDASTGGPGGSDHSGFIEKGIESLALMTSGGIGHPDYHDAGDDTAKIDPEILRKTGQFVLQGTINLATEPSNLVVADRQHLYHGMRMTLLNLADPRGGVTIMMAGPIITVSAGQQPGQIVQRLNITLDPSAFGGNTALIDVAAKAYGVGRVDVPARGDGTWFTQSGVTERGATALKTFESNSIVLNLMAPSKALFEDVLEKAQKPFIVTGLATMPDAVAAKKVRDKNGLLAVEFDPTAPQALATRLIELKKLLGDSGSLLLTTRDLALPADPARLRAFNEAKQQLYLALIKDGWTKDEIYSMVGVNPAPPPGGPMAMPTPGRLPGNLGRLSATPVKTTT
jgi:hypothetical protein